MFSLLVDLLMAAFFLASGILLIFDSEGFVHDEGSSKTAACAIAFLGFISLVRNLYSLLKQIRQSPCYYS